MKNNEENTVGCGKGCSIGCFSVMMIFLLAILTMCTVPREQYEPYISAGNEYYETVFEMKPKITHDFMLADEGGGFGIHVQFTEEQKKNPIVKLYMSGLKSDKEFSFRGTSPEPNIVGISYEETSRIKKMNVFSDFNQPISDMLEDLLYKDENHLEIEKLTNAGELKIYSTDLTFWKNVINNYEQLKSKPFNERIDWLSHQMNDETYFYVTRYLSFEEISKRNLTSLMSVDEEKNIEVLSKEIFSKEITKSFPHGTIFDLRIENHKEEKLYELSDTNELVNSRFEYPVTY